jgi:hypothetical protein
MERTEERQRTHPPARVEVQEEAVTKNQSICGYKVKLLRMQ